MNSRQSSTSFVAAAAVMLTAILLYDVMGAIIKHLTQQYSAPQLSLFRNVFGLIPTLLILSWSRSWIAAGRPVVIKQWRLAFIRGGLAALAQVSFYLSLFHLEFATATAMLFAGPLFVTALSVPVLGHRVGPWRWLAALVGFAGVLLVMRPATQSFTWYALLPLCAAFGYASVSVTAQLFDKKAPTALINLYQNAGSLTGSVVLVLATSGFAGIESLTDGLWLAAMGIAGGTGAFCLISAYRMADPSSLSPLEYFAIPFSFCLGWVFFAEAPFERLIPGVFLIIGGGLLLAWREHSLKRRRPSA